MAINSGKITEIIVILVRKKGFEAMKGYKIR